MSEHWVVVGAGSAGCVAAARLSEDDRRSVTLVEAGPALVPGGVPAALDGMDFLAALDEPGRVHRDLTARRRPGAEPVPYLRGRGVGGSSAVNALVGLRGASRQYERWGWDDVEAAWARVLIPVERAAPDELGSVDRALLAAATDAERAPLTRAGGRRITSAEAYLWPASIRENLVVRPDTPVRRVLFDGRRAVGVMLGDGTELPADQIVLAAGAIHTPAILLRSDVDTPGVGTGLQDHPAAPVTLELYDGAVTPPGDLPIGALLQRGDHQVLPMNHLGAEPAGRGLGLLMVALMRPRGAAGRISLRPSDPFGEPDVEFGLLDDPADVAALRRGVGVLRGLLAHDAFSEIVRATSIDDDGTPLDALTDDDAVDRWLRSSCGDYVHASGSCAMGRVVDEAGRLVGYDAVRICDASVFPSIPDVNTHLPVTMLAERLAARWSVG